MPVARWPDVGERLPRVNLCADWVRTPFRFGNRETETVEKTEGKRHWVRVT